MTLSPSPDIAAKYADQKRIYAKMMDLEKEIVLKHKLFFLPEG